MGFRDSWRRLLAVAGWTIAITAAPWASPAQAHDQPYSFLDLEIAADSLRGRFTAHVFDLAHEIGLAAPETLLQAAAAARHADALRAAFAPRLTLVADGDTLRPRWTTVVPDAERRGVAFGFAAPWRGRPAALEVAAAPFPYDPEHEVYLVVTEGPAVRHQDLLDAGRTRATVYAAGARGAWAVIRIFAASGVHHIFIGPDHILFLLGLLLPGGGFARLFKIVTAFTLAHSLTLAAATFGLVDPPGHLVEPVIALSIVYVGVENLRARGSGRDHRALIAFGFGLVHGFGFASVLRDFGLPPQALGVSLFAFNLGVELGQAAIVLLAAPPLALLRRRAPAAGRAARTLGSWVVIAAGAWWLVERLFLPGR